MAICGRCGKRNLKNPTIHVLACKADSFYKASLAQRPFDSGSESQSFERVLKKRSYPTHPDKIRSFGEIWGSCIRATDRISRRLDKIKDKQGKHYRKWLKKLQNANWAEEQARMNYIQAGGKLPVPSRRSTRSRT